MGVQDRAGVNLGISVLVIAAFALRAAAGTVRYHDTSWWESGYSHYADLARNVAAGDGFHIGALYASRPPLYPLLLAAEYRLAGEANLLPVLVQSAIGAGTVFVAFLLARTMFDRRVAILAALLMAIYPYYVAHDPALQETGLFTFLTAATVYALVRAARSASSRDHAIAGCCIGLDVLCRETIVVFVPLALGWLFWYQRPARTPGVLSRVALTLLATSVIVTPWVVRNAVVYGKPVLSGGQGFGLGYRMWVGYNDFTLVRYPWNSIDESTALAFGAFSPAEEAELDNLDQHDRERWFMHRALRFIAAHPWTAVKYAIVKILAGISPMLSPTTGAWWRGVIYTASYTPILMLAVAGAILARDRWRELRLLYLLGASFVVASVVAHAHTSHRSYLDVYLAMLASYALVGGVARVPKRYWHSVPTPYARA